VANRCREYKKKEGNPDAGRISITRKGKKKVHQKDTNQIKTPGIGEKSALLHKDLLSWNSERREGRRMQMFRGKLVHAAKEMGHGGFILK